MDTGARVLVFEGGEASRFTEKAIREGVDGALRVMAVLQMVGGKRKRSAHPWREAKKARWVRAGRAGVLRSGVSLGEEVRKGQVLGVVSDILGQDADRVIARHQGMVFGRRINPLVHPGDAVVHLADV